MATIHRTTLSPSKLELLTSWLPSQPWYLATGQDPDLVRAGGFRLDDPAGAVGIEFMVVTDRAGGEPGSYLIPLSYRGAPLVGAEDALVGEAEHGVLGRRWIYDGTRDAVLVGQLVALLWGEVQAQAQSVSDKPDPSVVSSVDRLNQPESAAVLNIGNGPHGTDLTMKGGLTIRVVRLLEPGEPEPALDLAQPRGYVEAGWVRPDGVTVRGPLVLVQTASAP
jgi:Maltokinase N-terminal cap domain